MTLSLDAAMRDFNPALPLAVGLSGGADSTALLLACAAKWPEQVVAFHINHGLQAAAGLFEHHCQTLCDTLGVPLRIARVDARHAKGDSPEDAARQARYASFDALALAECAQAAIKSIAIAQHADDQVETILLALSRGAGLGGLSAMPRQWCRGSVDFHRPLLSVTSADIRTWLRESGVNAVEDPSNQNEQFTRNRIRARLMPALQAAFPQFHDTFARSARHAAQAQALLNEVASEDWVKVIGAEAVNKGPLIRALQALSRARQANVLRFWLKNQHQVVPSAAQLTELMRQIAACTTRGHRIHIKVGQGYIQRQGPVLTWYNP
jgi:tRNA(Ile)-lysidine synthase